MAVPAYATDLTDIYTDTDNFSTVGGGRVTATETDDYIQGSNCWSHDPFSSGIEGGIYDAVTAPTIATDDAVYVWTKCDVAATLATHAAGGIQVLIGDSATVFDCFYVAGSDDYVYGGWKCYPVDLTLSPSTSVGTPTTFDHFGVRWNVPATGASKGYPMKIDAIREGRNIEVTAGDGTTPATWDATATHDATTTRQWGICQPTNTGAALQGRIYWGTAAASVYSRDSNRSIVIIDTEWTSTDFTQILFAHASNDIEWDNVGLIALGTNNRGIIDVTANGAVTWTNSVFQGIDITNLLAGSTFDGSKWLGTNAVTAPGSSLLGSSFLEPTVAADTAVLVWDTATDTDGLLDGAEFVSHDTTAHHAIEFTTFATSFDLVDLDFTGFGAEAATDAALYFPDTGSDRAWVVNLIGCTGTINFKKVRAGDTVSLVINPVTTTVTCVDSAGDPIVGARVWAHVTSSVGGWPYQASVTSITRSGTTATATQTAHGLSTNDWVYIQGATDQFYNGTFQITVLTADTYTYTMLGTPAASASGTLLATFVVLNGTTNGSGIISATYSYTASQPISGMARDATAPPPYYRATPISGTIDSASGLPLTVLMGSDE